MRILEYQSLRALNTFGLDVSARYFTEAHSTDELLQIFESYPITAQHLILGGGSNILFRGDYSGLVIKIGLRGIKVIDESENQVIVRAAAGEDWDSFVEHCVRQGWGGLENLSLIPGQVGSSPIQNIGAYGVELKDNFHQLEALEKETGRILNFDSQTCSFGYRDSFFKQEGKNRYVILSVSFKLTKKKHRLSLDYGSIFSILKKKGISSPTLADLRQIVCDIRRSKLPDPAITGNAGSFFKNPVLDRWRFEQLKETWPHIVAYPDPAGVKLAAGWLIDQAGWKGFRRGDAGIHHKQALVMVNHGKAIPKELINLSEEIKDSVFQKFGITLETEVNIV